MTHRIPGWPPLVALAVLFAIGCADDAVELPAEATRLAALEQVRLVPIVTNSVGMTLVGIMPGSFVAGSPESEQGRDSEREAQRPVTIERPFYIGAAEVTQGQWRAVMGTDRKTHFKGDDLPMDSLSWDDARAFVQALSALEGKPYRLPTDDEWEYAARAGTTTAWSSGERLRPRHGNIRSAPITGAADLSSKPRSTKVAGSFEANAWGLFDVHGSVCEWTAEASLRGGAWKLSAHAARSAASMRPSPGRAWDVNGVRVVLDVTTGSAD